MRTTSFETTRFGKLPTTGGVHHVPTKLRVEMIIQQIFAPGRRCLLPAPSSERPQLSNSSGCFCTAEKQIGSHEHVTFRGWILGEESTQKRKAFLKMARAEWSVQWRPNDTQEMMSIQCLHHMQCCLSPCLADLPRRFRNPSARAGAKIPIRSRKTPSPPTPERALQVKNSPFFLMVCPV